MKITCGLLKKAMEKLGWGSKKFVIDGYPRNQDNYDGWQEVLGDSVEVPMVLLFETKEDELVARILERGKSSQRNDDNLDVFKKRMEVFHKETMPIAKLYEEQGKLKRINGLGSVDEVY